MNSSSALQSDPSLRVELTGRYVAPTDAQIVLAALDTGEWEVTRSQDLPSLTAAANQRNAWVVRRQTAPFCTEEGVRLWTGGSALEALTTAAEQLQVQLPIIPAALEAADVKRDEILREVARFGFSLDEKLDLAANATFERIKQALDAYAVNIYETVLSATKAAHVIPADYGDTPREGCGLEGAVAKLEWAAGTLFEIKEKLKRGETLDHVWDSQAFTMASAIIFVAKQVAAQEAAGQADTDRLDAIERLSISVAPDNGTPWKAMGYRHNEHTPRLGTGLTPRQAVDAVMKDMEVEPDQEAFIAFTAFPDATAQD